MTPFQKRAAVAMLTAVAACGGGGPTSSDGIASVRMNANAISLFAGQTENLAASALDAAGLVVASAPAAVWSSSNASIATVTQAGVVSAIANGQADIIAKIGSKRGTTRVTVGAPPTAVTVSMPGNSFSPYTSVIKVGGTVTFEFPQTTHNVIFDPRTGVPTDIQATQNTTVQRTFGVAGLFAFTCTLHDGMKGEVSVVP